MNLPVCLSTFTVLFVLLMNTSLVSLLFVFVGILFYKASGPLSLTTGLEARIWCFNHCDPAQSLGPTQALLQAIAGRGQTLGTYLSGHTERGAGVWSQESAAEESPRTLHGGTGSGSYSPGPSGTAHTSSVSARKSGACNPLLYPSNRPFLTSQGQDKGVWEPENLLAKLSPWGSLPSVLPSMCLE